MKRKQFTFYGSFFDAMSEMSMTARGKAVTILCQYALEGIEPEPQKGAMKIYCDLVLPNLRASRKKALAGQVGAGVTNRKRSGKKENEIEIENEIEHKCVASDAFERFWDLYPVKIGKEEAWELWRIKAPQEEQILEALQVWKQSRQWIKDAGQYIPRAAKFLEQEYYRQKPEVAAPVGALGQLGQAEIEALEKIMREEIK